jgi:hypothetical protein
MAFFISRVQNKAELFVLYFVGNLKQATFDQWFVPLASKSVAVNHRL